RLAPRADRGHRRIFAAADGADRRRAEGRFDARPGCSFAADAAAASAVPDTWTAGLGRRAADSTGHRIAGRGPRRLAPYSDAARAAARRDPRSRRTARYPVADRAGISLPDGPCLGAGRAACRAG